MSASEPTGASRRGLLDTVSSLLVAWIPAVVIGVTTLLVSQQAADREARVMGALCESEIGRVQQELLGGLNARAAAVERLGLKWEEGGDAWRDEADALTRGPFGFRAVVAFDSARVPRAWVPDEARVMSTLDPRDDTARANVLDVAAGFVRGGATTVMSAPLESGEPQVLVCAPLERNGSRLGWLMGVTRLHDVLDPGLARTVQSGFSVGVFQGATRIYGASSDSGGPGARYVRDAAVLRGPLLWRVELWPAEDLDRELESWGSRGVFVAGTLLACCVAAWLHLGRLRRGSRSPRQRKTRP